MFFFIASRVVKVAAWLWENLVLESLLDGFAEKVVLEIESKYYDRKRPSHLRRDTFTMTHFLRQDHCMSWPHEHCWNNWKIEVTLGSKRSNRQHEDTFQSEKKKNICSSNYRVGCISITTQFHL